MKRQYVGRVALTAVALFAATTALNLGFTLHHWVPMERPVLIVLPGLLSMLFMWATVGALSASHTTRQRIRLPLTLVAGITSGYLVGFSLMEAAFQYIYARPFVPRLDIPMVRSLLQLTLGDIGGAVRWLAPIAIIVVFALLFAYGILLQRTIFRVGESLQRRLVPTLVPAAVVITILAGGGAVVGAHAAWPRPILPRAVVAWAEDGTLDLTALPVVYDENPVGAPGAPGAPSASGTPDDVVTGDVAERQPTAASGRNTPRYVFPGLRDRDIYVFAVEAYGYATVSREQLSRELTPYRNRLEATLREYDYQVATAYLRSPVAGGFSWLAEATFLTGQWINSQPGFEQLYGAHAPTLTGMLQAGGYYTLTARPGTVHASWPEGWDLYRFMESLVAHDGDFAYNGPWFSYVPITDQYAIWRTHRRIEELVAPNGAAAERPLLAYYQLVSSHTPFNRIPPFVEPWEDLGDGSVYRARSAEILTFDNTWGGGSELDEGYLAAISYVFTTITRYISDHMLIDRAPIIIIFGDHQAQRPIREQNAHLSVPIHVATADADVLERFLARGFERGMVGTQQPPHPEMSTFFPLFADVARDIPLAMPVSTVE